LISGLLVQQNNSMTEQLSSVGNSRHPRAVQRVLDYVNEFPGSQFSIGDLASIAGVSARQLQNLFHERFDMSPSAYVRNVRLDGVRATLREVDGTTRIGEVALGWGFNHMGRFAKQYEQKFGESPSRTLRSATRAAGGLTTPGDSTLRARSS
jgi:transcriptional regulator GlxA family with amidase domain